MNESWRGNEDLRPLLRPIGELKNDPNNARAHGERDLEAILRSFRQFGQAKPIVALKTGVVIAGNGSLLAAKRLGWSHLAVTTFADRKKARAFAIADNRTAELSTWDENELARSLAAMSQDLLVDVGFSNEELDELLSRHDFSNIEPLDEMPTVTERTANGLVSMSFTLSSRQASLISDALAAVKKKGVDDPADENKNKNGNALSQICVEYLEGQQ